MNIEVTTFACLTFPHLFTGRILPEELYVRKYLRENNPDIIINVVDASNLERNLYLTTELIDMDRSMVIALNMYDELQASGANLNYKELGGMIGVPMVPVVARNGEGINALLDTVINVYEGKTRMYATYT